MRSVPYARYRSHSALILALSLIVGCDNGSGPGSVMPAPMTGANGESVAVTGLAKNATVPCQAASGDVWSFGVNFSAAHLDGTFTAQLLVEVDKDASGQDVWGSNRGPYVQFDSASVGPGAPTGILQGRIGPPVSTRVRFNIAVRLVNSTGAVVAVGDSVSGLRPVLQ